MTLREFGEFIEEYYGQYNAVQRQEVVNYLRGMSPQYLDSLKAVIVRNYSSMYGKPPDVAIFEKHKAESLEGLKEYVRAIEAPRDETVSIDGQKVLDEIIQRARRNALKAIEKPQNNGETGEQPSCNYAIL